MPVCVICATPLVIAKDAGPKRAATRKFCSVACDSRHRLRAAIDLFWSRVSRGEGCWEWQGKRLNTGYGRTNSTVIPLLAHRAAWTIIHGPIPERMVIRHHCDNPLCVRPDHLALGTQRDNVLDMVERGRHRSGGLSGEAAHNHKLSTEAVRQIRADKITSNRELAERYGVAHSTISRVRRGVMWRTAA